MKRTAQFKDRFNDALEQRRLKPVDIHRRTGISEATISQYRSGYAEPKKTKLGLLADALDVNPAWLMGLDVEMSVKSNGDDIASAYCLADEKTKKAVRILLGIDK